MKHSIFWVCQGVKQRHVQRKNSINAIYLQCFVDNLNRQTTKRIILVHRAFPVIGTKSGF